MANTAFGELQVAELTPMCGWTFAYNVNPALVATATTGSGTVTSDGGFAELNTTANTNSSAVIKSKAFLKYTPGQGAICRFACVFDTPKAGSKQIIGIGDAEDGFFFGYNGLDFGVLRRRDGTDTWTLQANWSYDLHSNSNWISDLDYTKGNVYQIQFQWLGSGEIRYSIENPESGVFERVHEIRYANSSAQTSILNPTLPVYAFVENTTNDSAITLKTASALGACEGRVENPAVAHPFALSQSFSNSKSTVTTETNMLTLKSQATWQSISNRITSQLSSLSVACEGNKPTVVRITKNTTLGGTPSYSDVSSDESPIQVDTAGTTLTGGAVVYSVYLQKLDSKSIDLSKANIRIFPGETLTISAESTSGTDVDVGVNWYDLL